MPEYVRSPKLFKGTLVLYEKDTSTSPATVLPFQYNPEQVRRTLAVRSSGGPGAGDAKQGAREDVLRQAGPPVETINLSIVLSAYEQLEHPESNPSAAEKGVHPALAALEMLMYPPSLDAEKLEKDAKKGKVQVKPAALPLAVLVWGGNRVVPVSVTSFAVTEEHFDPRLNPIRAKVDLGLKVLTYLEFPGDTVGRDAYFAYQKHKEELAAEFTGSADDSRIRTYLPAGRRGGG